MKAILSLLLVLGVALLVVVFAVAGEDDGDAAADEGPVFVTWGAPPSIKMNQKAPPPEELGIEDLKQGDGEEATEGDEVTVNFAAASWNGLVTSSSWDGTGAEPLSFVLGLSPPAVDPGWDRGMEGMKEGGRRELVVPPELLYFPRQVSKDELVPTDAEIFLVELVDVEPR